MKRNDSTRNERFGLVTAGMIRFLAVFLAASLLSCDSSDLTGLELNDEPNRVELTDDLRDYARQARANLARMTAEQRADIEPLLADHESAVARFDRLMAMGQTRRAVLSPLVGMGAYMVLNDSTGVGVADDVLLPFIALGLVAGKMATSPPASGGALLRAYDQVRSTAEAVSQKIEEIQNYGVAEAQGTEAQGITEARSESQAMPGTREHCIAMYVDCKQNASRGFDLRRCQPCMDLCLGSDDFTWPRTAGCKYLKTSRRPRRKYRTKILR